MIVPIALLHCLLLHLFLLVLSIDAFGHERRMSSSCIAQHGYRSSRENNTLLFANKKTVKPKGGSGGGKNKAAVPSSAAAGIRGFGMSSVVEVDRSRETRAFYDYLESNGAGDTLKRTSIGNEPPGVGGDDEDNADNDTNASSSSALLLRGVLCTREIAKGADIINIPSSLAINLGPEGGDPTLPAVEFLKDYCAVMMQRDNDGSGGRSSSPSKGRYAYYRMLPGYGSSDCKGSTDFFSDAALDALQSPLIAEETRARRLLTAARFVKAFGGGGGVSDSTAAAAPAITWIDGSPLTADHLQWAVWLITSRVLTVQTAVDSSSSSDATSSSPSSSCRLLIPYLDMCNHDRASPHILTGRVGGDLKVKAGVTVKPGDVIRIPYGGGDLGNDRFVQDYGFTDPSPLSYDIVAQIVLGKRRVQEGSRAGRTLPPADQDASLAALRATTMREDATLLRAPRSDPAVRSAIQYRLGVKKALSKYILIQ
jgi:hypothetical protein